MFSKQFWKICYFYAIPTLEKLDKKQSRTEPMECTKCTSLDGKWFVLKYCLGFWTSMRFHKNLRSDTNFKIVYSEHLLWVDLPAATEMIIVSGESWPGSVLDAASFHSLGFVTKYIYINIFTGCTKKHNFEF